MSDEREHELEARLRVAMSREAASVTPEDRLDEIREEIASGGRRGRPTWFLPLAVAAAVAVIAGVAWIGLRPGLNTPTPSATTSATTPATPSPSPTGGTPPATSASPTGPVVAPSTPAGTALAVPVFYVAPDTGQPDSQRWGLVREFVSATLPSGADPQTLAQASVDLALTGPRDANPNNYVPTWPEGTTATVAVGPGQITVTLSSPGVAGLTPDQQRLAVQQLVWSATAAAQRNVPVRIDVKGGGPIVGSVAAGVFSRPPADTAYEVLAPIWVDSPAQGQVVAAGTDVVVKGQACVFEGTVSWQLSRGGGVVREDHTQATSGCPSQGSWSVDLGSLAAGDYTFRAIEVSAKDGSVAAQHLVSFTVR